VKFGKILPVFWNIVLLPASGPNPSILKMDTSRSSETLVISTRLHCVTYQKTAFFLIASVGTTNFLQFYSWPAFRLHITVQTLPYFIKISTFLFCRFKLLRLVFHLDHCFSTFVTPRPGKFFFIRRGPGPNKFTRKYLFNFI
jgi:hypothetical protein